MSINGRQEEPTLSDLALQCMQDSERWFGDNPAVINSVAFNALCMAGEVGEFCNIVKKIERGSLDGNTASVRYDLAMELTDVFIYMLQLAGLMRLDLYKAYMTKRGENERRFTEARKEREASND